MLKKVEKLFEFYEGAIHKKNFNISPFRNSINKSLASRQNYEDEGKDVMQFFVNLIRNSLYGEQFRKDVEDSFARKSESWMMTEYYEKKKIIGKYLI